jgi:excisionase family DNA binding protein
MDALLTTRQVQSILKIDRTTIYRMLKDGRLKGLKIGQQWRFREADVRALLNGESNGGPPTQRTQVDTQIRPPEMERHALPVDHIQSLQDVFANLGGVGAVTTNLKGVPCTRISNACAFCRLILETPTGLDACMTSWQALAHLPYKQTRYYQCHAGLRYARAMLEVESYPPLMFVLGQFLLREPSVVERADCVDLLSQVHGLDANQLHDAAAQIPIFDGMHAEDLQYLLTEAVRTLEQIGEERADLLRRLQDIARLSEARESSLKLRSMSPSISAEIRPTY